jgi:hypothetical protein
MVNCATPASRADAYWAHVERVVNEAPPLDDEQRAELRELLRVGREARRMAGAR